MRLMIEKADARDAVAMNELYDSLIDHLAATVNYPGWERGLYPTRETAEEAIRAGTLYVCRAGDQIAGGVILNHECAGAYAQGRWNVFAGDGEVLYVHTLAVHPEFMKKGVAGRLLAFARAHAARNGMKALRLDVSARNQPAIALYEKYGYRCAGTVDLGLGIPDLVWFRLYELVLHEGPPAFAQMRRAGIAP